MVKRAQFSALIHPSPLLRRHCSLHRSPLDDLSASLMASSSDNASDHYRLPTEVRPRHYDLTIRTDLEKEKFNGFVKIECVRRLFFRVVDRSASSLAPQPRNRESDQGRHLQCRSRAFARLGDPCPLLPRTRALHLPRPTSMPPHERVSLTFAEELPAGTKADPLSRFRIQADR
jgi:hypothetical protein